jgi:hypothetical protein
VGLLFTLLRSGTVCHATLQQYILANAAVSRSFSAYFAALIGKPTTFFTMAYNDYTVDFLAAGLMIACGILLSFSTAGGSLFNTIVTGVVWTACALVGSWSHTPDTACC